MKIQRDPLKGVSSIRRQDAARRRQYLVSSFRRRLAISPSNPDGFYEGDPLDESAFALPEAGSSSRSAHLDEMSLISIACSAAENREASLELILALFDDPEERRKIEEAAQTARTHHEVAQTACTRDEAAEIRPMGSPNSAARWRSILSGVEERDVQPVQRAFLDAALHMRANRGAEGDVEEFDVAAIMRVLGEGDAHMGSPNSAARWRSILSGVEARDAQPVQRAFLDAALHMRARRGIGPGVEDDAEELDIAVIMRMFDNMEGSS